MPLKLLSITFLCLSVVRPIGTRSVDSARVAGVNVLLEEQAAAVETHAFRSTQSRGGSRDELRTAGWCEDGDETSHSLAGEHAFATSQCVVGADAPHSPRRARVPWTRDPLLPFATAPPRS